MKYLVFGANGSIGSLLLNRLKENGNNVFPINRVFDVEKIKSFLDGDQRSCFVIASGWAPPRAMKGDELIKGNILYQKKIVELAQLLKPKGLINLSTVSVYGSVKSSVLTEREPINNPTFYGLSKLIGEKIVSEIKDDLFIVNLRLPGVLGKNVQNSWLFRAMVKLKKHETLLIHSPNSLFNNVIHTSELIRFIKYVVKSNFSFESGLAVNFSASKPVVFGKVIEFIRERFDSNSVILTEKGGTSFYVATRVLSDKFSYYARDTFEQVKLAIDEIKCMDVEGKTQWP